MIDIDWLTSRLVAVLKWQMASEGAQGGPDVPIAGLRVWSIFLELSASRGAGGFGPNPISFQEMESWSRMRREPLRQFEIDILRELDASFMAEAVRAADDARDPNKKKRVVSQRPLTMELLDAYLGVT